MGAQNSNLRRSIEDDFASRVEETGRDWLCLDELLALQLPQFSWSLELSHLGVLFVLDRERDGRFSLGNVLDLLQLGRQRARMYQPHEFAAQLSGYCMLQLWRFLSADSGRSAFVDWISKLMLENRESGEFPKHPGHAFINRECIESLHQILNIKENQGLDFQSFFDVLQRNAEEAGLMDPEDESLDDWVPLVTVQDLAGCLADGIKKTMGSVCPGDASTLQF